MKKVFYSGLFLLELFSLYVHFPIPFGMELDDKFFTFKFFFMFFILVTVEIWLSKKVIGEREIGKLIKPILICHLPWLLSWVWPLLWRITLPDPQNFDLRKVEI